MRIVICANEHQQSEIIQKRTGYDLDIRWFDQPLKNIAEADAYFNLLFDDEYPVNNYLITNVPVFVNAVITTSALLPENYVRINAWNGFLGRPVIEISSSKTQSIQKTTPILEALGWKFIIAPDEPGMIAARILAMIINEAYFALGDKVSTKEEIDIAMKLGTNYPYGPFEWSRKIGLKKIGCLLKKLTEKDSRYIAAPLLLEEVSSANK